jgi:hypothetical protein
MACLTAGMVGCGGGPGILFFPSRSLEAAGLQEGVGDHRHQRVSVKTRPGPPLEMVETKLLLELLMRLFADPSGLDGGGERLEAGVGWQVRGVVFPFAGRTAFADQPNLCIDPEKSCSCYKGERSDEYDDGRQHQALDGEA